MIDELLISILKLLLIIVIAVKRCMADGQEMLFT